MDISCVLWYYPFMKLKRFGSKAIIGAAAVVIVAGGGATVALASRSNDKAPIVAHNVDMDDSQTKTATQPSAATTDSTITTQTPIAAAQSSSQSDTEPTAPQNPYQSYGTNSGLGFVWQQLNSAGKTMPDVGTTALGNSPISNYYHLLLTQGYQFASSGQVGSAVIYSVVGSGKIGIVTSTDSGSYTIQVDNTGTSVTIPDTQAAFFLN